jgi:hypothetical protein
VQPRRVRRSVEDHRCSALAQPPAMNYSGSAPSRLRGRRVSDKTGISSIATAIIHIEWRFRKGSQQSVVLGTETIIGPRGFPSTASTLPS